MRKISTIALSVFLLSNPLLADDIEERIASSRAAAKALGSSLKSELEAAVKSGGVISAIPVCNTKAPTITADKSKELAMDVGRTSLKIRNPNNAPDEWESAMLKQFEERKAAGEAPAKLDAYEIVEQDGKKVFRYIKAIPMDKVCVVCHGADIKDELSAKLDELYPEDKARGFQEDDLRGAFTITQPM